MFSYSHVGDQQPCPRCRSRRLQENSNKSLVCLECGEVQDVIAEAAEPSQTAPSFASSLRRISEARPRAERKGSPDQGKTQRKQFDDFEVYNEAFQRILLMQIRSLVNDHKLPGLLSDAVRDIWFRFLAEYAAFPDRVHDILHKGLPQHVEEKLTQQFLEDSCRFDNDTSALDPSDVALLLPLWTDMASTTEDEASATTPTSSTSRLRGKRRLRPRRDSDSGSEEDNSSRPRGLGSGARPASSSHSDSDSDSDSGSDSDSDSDPDSGGAAGHIGASAGPGADSGDGVDVREVATRGLSSLAHVSNLLTSQARVNGENIVVRRLRHRVRKHARALQRGKARAAPGPRGGEGSSERPRESCGESSGDAAGSSQRTPHGSREGAGAGLLDVGVDIENHLGRSLGATGSEDGRGVADAVDNGDGVGLEAEGLRRVPAGPSGAVDVGDRQDDGCGNVGKSERRTGTRKRVLRVLDGEDEEYDLAKLVTERRGKGKKNAADGGPRSCRSGRSPLANRMDTPKPDDVTFPDSGDTMDEQVEADNTGVGPSSGLGATSPDPDLTFTEATQTPQSSRSSKRGRKRKYNESSTSPSTPGNTHPSVKYKAKRRARGRSVKRDGEEGFIHRLPWTLGFCFLGCMWVREAVLPLDLARWASDGSLPYLTAYARLPQHLQTCRDKPNPFRPRTLPSGLIIEMAARAIRLVVGVHLPPLNGPLLTTRLSRQLAFPDCVAACASALWTRLDLHTTAPAFFATKRMRIGWDMWRLPTVLAVLVIAAKIVFRLGLELDGVEDVNTTCGRTWASWVRQRLLTMTKAPDTLSLWDSSVAAHLKTRDIPGHLRRLIEVLQPSDIGPTPSAPGLSQVVRALQSFLGPLPEEPGPPSAEEDPAVQAATPCCLPETHRVDRVTICRASSGDTDVTHTTSFAFLLDEVALEAGVNAHRILTAVRLLEDQLALLPCL